MAEPRRWLPQFSLRGFLIATLAIALGVIGVLSASDGWTFALGAAFHLLLPAAAIFAIAKTGEKRAFWIGVVVVSVWCNLLFHAKNELLARDRLLEEFNHFLDARISTHIAKLHEDRSTQIAEESIERLTEESGGLTDSAIAMHRSQGLMFATRHAKTLATTSLRRFLMILLSLGGGCLSACAYRCRESSASHA